MNKTIQRGAVLICLMVAGCDVFVSNETRVERAEQYLTQGNQRGAIIELKNVVEDEPDNGRARSLLAQALFQLGDVEAAQAELNRASELGARSPSDSQLHADLLLAQRKYKELEQWLTSDQQLEDESRSLLLARAKLGQGDLEAGQQILQTALKKNPSSPELQRGVAEVLAAKGDREGALNQLGQMLEKDPKDARALLMQASLLMQGGRIESAEQAYTAALEHGSTSLTLPQKIIATAAQVEIQLARGDLAKAEKAHNDLSTLAPDSIVSKLLSARISLSKQDYSAASAELQRVVSQMPNFVAARALLGSALYAQGSYEQAERHLTEVIRQAPAHIEARKLLAQLRLRMNQPAEAMNVLVPALESEDTDAEVNALANSAQLRIGDESAALALLEKSVQRHPDKPELKLQLANAYLRTGQSDKAVSLLRQIEGTTTDNVAKEALLVAAVADSKGLAAAQQEVEGLMKAHPRNVTILNLASSFFLRRGDFERARAALARANAVEPKNILTTLSAARIEMSAGKISVAEGMYRQVLETDPENAAAYLGLAEIAMRQGKNTEAVNWLEQLAKREPQAVEPRLALARLHLSQKNPTAAEQAVSEALEITPDKAPVHNAAGMMYLQAGRLDAALAAFRAASSADSGNVGYLINQARAERALGQLEAARVTAARALSSQPKNLSAVAMNAFLDVEAKRPEAALARVDALKKQRPNDPTVFVLEGELLMALQRPADAAVALERAASMRDSAMTSIKLYQARRAAGATNALQPLESWVAKNPDDLSVRRLLASAYQTSGRNSKALAEYEYLVSQAPADAPSLNNLAWLRYQEGDARAEQAAASAYQLAPDNAAIGDTYGWILLEKGDVERALDVLSKAAKQSNQPDIQYHYAAALAKSGSTTQAQEILASITNSTQSFESKAEAQTLLRELSGG
jgi:cellulose synthase operon protein C